MKFALLVIVAAVAGALAMFAVPVTVIQSASLDVRGFVDRSGLTEIHLTNINPFRSIFDYEQQQIRMGLTPEQLGIHSSAITVTPMRLGPPQVLKLDLSRAFEVQAESQILQNERRMQDLQAYGRHPMHWESLPPN